VGAAGEAPLRLREARAAAISEKSFCGLSPEQMHGLLHRPLASPQLLMLADELPEPPEAPVARLFGLLADAFGERGVRPTAKGYLPRALCREVAQAYLGEAGYAEMTRSSGAARRCSVSTTSSGRWSASRWCRTGSVRSSRRQRRAGTGR